MLQKELWHRGLRYRKNAKTVYGKPDIAFIGKKIAVFCDSEFFHGYDWENKNKEIKSNRDFWIPKIEKNMQRDREVTEKLTSEGWTVLRFSANTAGTHYLSSDKDSNSFIAATPSVSSISSWMDSSISGISSLTKFLK